ncbi:peptidoglycan-binding domain-containing protein [Rhodoplanes sp. SY1]|uniref:peptidoglycan-binding domain-containing protein n=1 Tax=Rhodoplanes sp. SY1 TaxID=3166646 RepID=UPI0038B481B6
MRDPVDDEDGRDGARAARVGRAGAIALRLFGRPRDTLAAAAGIAAFATVVINALYMQPGPHPAPIFALKTERPRTATQGMASAPTRDSTGTLAVLPRPRPADAQPTAKAEPAAATAAKPAARARPELVGDIQRELMRRGYYDGAIDGIAGSRTEAAIRDFEQAQGLSPTGEPTDAILKSITRATAKPKQAAPAPRPDPIAGLLSGSGPASASARTPVAPVVQAKAAGGAVATPLAAHPVAPVTATTLAAPPAPAPPQPIAHPRAGGAATAAGSSQIKSVQRALADYGYGQVRPTGTHDKATHDAIAAFEEARRMPVTGQVSDRLVRELVALTGRPIE